jgi:hypothetical protein
MPVDVRRVRLALVGTLNFLDATMDMCREAGIDAFATPLRTYAQGVRWLLSKEFRRANVIYQFGAGGIKYMLIAKLFGKKHVKHWIGTDAYIVTGAKGSLGSLWRAVYLSWPDMHLSVAQHLADVLQSNGVKVAGIVRNVTAALATGQVEPLPDTFTVLGYWTPGHYEFYRGDIVLNLARQMPDVKFLVVGTDGEGASAPANVEFLGWVQDMAAVYSRCSVLVRMPETDGACNMPLEMVVRGRYAIYNVPLEGCHLARDIDEVRQALLEIRRKGEPNYEGARLVKQKYSLAHEARVFRECMEQLAAMLGPTHLS